ncbi:uncharacterized protein [Rutidosis leptorrhynchoides]|uniref:uncharacterized protein n=1 Tax=Rutidosis leptorrhynchoides TaxID=125765 RepID=UPI003A98FFEC
MGREALCEFGTIVSTVHGMVKFPTPLGVATVFSDRLPIVGQVESSQQPAAPIEKGGNVVINHSFLKKVIQIGSTLSNETKSALCELLANNADVFAWQESDMTGVSCTVAGHCLNANPSLTPVRQKKRGMAPKRSIFLKNEVEKLVQADKLREVKYQTRVANPVLVKKANELWRMCVDFKDINKACPKDNYPLPEID